MIVDWFSIFYVITLFCDSPSRLVVQDCQKFYVNCLKDKGFDFESKPTEQAFYECMKQRMIH
jgi:hypothetical protein